MSQSTEQHPLGLFAPDNARLLMLGSFPPQRIRWSMDFFYPNFQNDMWRIVGLAFFADALHFVVEGRKGFNETEVRRFCQKQGIALGDTATVVRRLKDNASDKFLEIVERLDLAAVLEHLPLCSNVAVTGQKAMDTILTMVEAEEPAVGRCSKFMLSGREYTLWRMPSSSRAYPKPLSEKTVSYAVMFRAVFGEDAVVWRGGTEWSRPTNSRQT